MAAAALFDPGLPVSLLPTVLADEGSAVSAPSQAFRIPALQAARALMRAGQWEGAREILVSLDLEPRDDPEGIERLFLLGMVESRLGMPRSAARRFETILARRPDLTRVRLELARVYAALGRDEKASFHFRASLADHLPTSVEDAVATWLERIDARRRWSASLSLSILPESNPARRTESREVMIGGIPFRLGEVSRAASGTGLLINTGAQYSPVAGENLRGVLAGSVAGKYYRNDDWNDISVQGDVGIARLYDAGSLSGGMRYSQRWFGGGRYSDGTGPWVRGRRRVSPSIGMDFSLGSEDIAHRTHPDLDGRNLRLGIGIDWAPGAATAWRLSLDLEDSGARQKHRRSRLQGLGVTLTHAFRGGISVAPGVAVHWRRYEGADPLFLKTRRDRMVRLSVNLLHRKLQFHGFAPYVGLAREVNDSSIPINEYTNDSAVIGMSRNF